MQNTESHCKCQPQPKAKVDDGGDDDYALVMGRQVMCKHLWRYNEEIILFLGKKTFYPRIGKQTDSQCKCQQKIKAKADNGSDDDCALVMGQQVLC